MKKIRVFYVEDEQSLSGIVCDTLRKQGFDVDLESDGARVISYLEKNSPDICVLDIMLPNIDGYSLCRTIRGMYPLLPVIFLTAKTSTSDLVTGFQAGGTDYIKKPFTIEELIARIENQMNLRKGIYNQMQSSETIKIGDSVLDTVTYELKTPASTTRLSNRDMQVLRMLHANRNNVLSRKDLLISVWGDDSYFNSRNLDVYIKKLRNYLASDSSIRIITLKGSGYLFLIP
jgi:DNA-binding response OmpR family regulator